MKYFTVAEAEALIPELEKIYAAIGELRVRAEAKVKAVRSHEGRGNANPAELALEQGQLDFLAVRINELLDKITEMGALPKGIEPALVDFPYRLAGKEAYLCWVLGEKKITHYHGLAEGFAGRAPLPPTAA